MVLIKSTQKRILAWDLKTCVYLNQWSSDAKIASFFKGVSRLGDGIFWLIMFALLWYLKGIHYIFQLVYVLLFGSVGTFIYKILKSHTVRPRPYQVHQVIVLGERPLDHFSFPSGHTLHAVMISGVFGWIEPILLVLMLPFSLLIALSRMILGLHYPTDVLVGAGIGITMAGLMIYVAPLIGVVL